MAEWLHTRGGLPAKSCIMDNGRKPYRGQKQKNIVRILHWICADNSIEDNGVVWKIWKNEERQNFNISKHLKKQEIKFIYIAEYISYFLHVNKDVRKLHLQTCLPFFSIALKKTFTQQHWVYQYQGQDSRKFRFVWQTLYPNNSTNINDACDFKSLRGKNALARHFEMILYNKTRELPISSGKSRKGLS